MTSNAKTKRSFCILSALSGILGVLMLIFSFSINTGPPPGASGPDLAKFAEQSYKSVLWGAWLQAVGPIFVILFAFALVHLCGADRRLSGWMTFFGSKGFLNVTLMRLGIIAEPLEIMFTETAVVFGIIAVNLPYMVLTLQSVIEGIDRNVEEAAFSLGAAPMEMFRRVLLPLSLPGILAGTILTFILGMNAYATPVLLGGPKFRMMGPLIYGQFQLNNWPFGAAVAFVLMTTTLALTATANILVQRRFRR